MVACNPVQSMAAVPVIRAEKGKKILSEINIRPLKQQPSRPKIMQPPIVMGDKNIKDYLSKIRNPNKTHKNDLVLNLEGQEILKSVVTKFQLIRRYVGHGHFCVLGYDDAVTTSIKLGSKVAFTKKEISFLEDVFWRDAKDYGFMGEKQILHLGHRINKNDVYKVPYSGNYLFKGRSVEKYSLIKEKLGHNLILTSGIRGLAKQFYLFLSKANRFGGNLSLASRSLAPPGYSFHATGDFDVGQRGLGADNFSTSFTNTKIYSQLTNQGYVLYRYEKDNMLGVRYEPWHIKV